MNEQMNKDIEWLTKSLGITEKKQEAPKLTGIDKTFTNNLWSITPKKMKYSSAFLALTGIKKR